MKNTESFFHAMAWFCMGMVVGFLMAPIKKGVDIAICSHNVGAEDYAFLKENGDDDEE